jgi:NADP-dependent 3-hydroxy acid dehydrogenase YdfG
MTEKDLQGKRVLITGASSGIGKKTAEEFAARGADIAVASRRKGVLNKIAETLENESDTQALAVQMDVTDEIQVAQGVSSIIDAFGGLDIVVNNAGTGCAGPITETSTEEYRSVMSVNVDGMFFVTRETMPHLQMSEGSLLFVGSTSGRYPRPGYPIYAASKWWTRGFALSIAGQAGENGVAVTLINPGTTRTDFGSSFRTSNSKKYDIGEALDPEDVAETIAFAAKQEAPTTISELAVTMRDSLSNS